MEFYKMVEQDLVPYLLEFLSVRRSYRFSNLTSTIFDTTTNTRCTYMENSYKFSNNYEYHKAAQLAKFQPTTRLALGIWNHGCQLLRGKGLWGYQYAKMAESMHLVKVDWVRHIRPSQLISLNEEKVDIYLLLKSNVLSWKWLLLANKLSHFKLEK